MNNIRYKIYPSLLDKFQRLLDCDKRAEESWNIGDDGCYKTAPEEMSDVEEYELLKTINRVPHAPIEIADRGTCFNEVVDYEIMNGIALMDAHGESINGIYHKEMNGFSFDFDGELVKKVANRLTWACPQYYTEGVLPTKYGNVLLYGYIDYWVDNKVVDLKTTARYEFGKYKDNWQRYVYPWCLTEHGAQIDAMEFLIVKMKQLKGKPITGDIYKEYYTYNHMMATVKLTNIVERFIEWIEANRDNITDKKIFAEDE